MAELLIIPALAFMGIYTIQTQEQANNKRREGFDLPNTNIPDANFPNEYPIDNSNSDLTITSRLSTVNKFDGEGAYTDKYFMEEKMPSQTTNKYNSLSGPQSTDYFTHNNMQPFFGSKSRDIHRANDSNESVLDNMVGQGSQTISKREVAPLFDAKDGMTWANGMPNTSEFVRSRMNTSQYMSNVQPFAQERVGPGLGLGASNEGSGGFNSGMLGRESWIDKSVDELRVASKPKSSGNTLLGFEGAPDAQIKTLGGIGKFAKNGQETTFELGMERSIGALSSTKGNANYAEIIERFTNRPETELSYVGGAGPNGSNTGASLVDGEYMPSNRIDLGALPLGPVAGSSNFKLANVADFGLKSTMAYPNNRTTNMDDDYFGIATSALGSILSPIMDVLKPNRKNNVVGTLRPYQNPSAKVKNSYLVNTKDRTPTTNREMSDKEQNLWIVNSTMMQNGGGYMTAEQTPVENQRDYSTPNSSYIGGGKSSNLKQRDYSAELAQTSNGIRESTVSRSGFSPAGNMKLFNGDVNVFNNPNREIMSSTMGEFQNAPKSFNQMTPSLDIIGRSNGGHSLYSGMGLDRNTDEVMGEILKQNPYALSI